MCQKTKYKNVKNLIVAFTSSVCVCVYMYIGGFSDLVEF